VTSQATVAELRAIDLFDDLDDDALADFAAASEIREYARGELVADHRSGEQAVYLLIEGTGEAFTEINGRDEPAGDHVAPTWIGAISVVTAAPLGVRIIAKTDVRLARVKADDFVELAITHRQILQRVLGRVRPVVGRITAIEQQRERLESLGTMAAGLAHELNNPAAAAKRSATELADALDVLSSTIGVFLEAGVQRADVEQLVEMQRAALASCRLATGRSALDAADAEDEMTDALADLGVGDGWRLAEPLSHASVDRAFLERVQTLAGPATPAALNWIAASLAARQLAAELTESTDRMSTLVGAIKTYAYMDRGDVVDIDVTEGIETTLTILGHKLKHTQIEVVRDYDPQLGTFLAHGAELNQVWTNLIDNAIGALGETGTITLTTHRDNDCAVVIVADDGPGIPPEIQDRVFEPFFTTKGVGQGTGLGLETARRIVGEGHGGSLSLDSQPGKTVFTVRLPMTRN
jgi:signal transduction histidine kinase